jgi:hypothetical protein
MKFDKNSNYNTGPLEMVSKIKGSARTTDDPAAAFCTTLATLT